MPLHTALFCEASPGPVKYAASLLGIAGATTRQPLVEIEDSSKRAVEAALKAAELL
jgi:4-hydroxy-tetrahydrodipicolinate synthase